MHNPTYRIAHTTAFVTPVVEHWLERVIAQWVQIDGSIRRPITSERVAGFLSRYLSGPLPYVRRLIN